MFFNFFRYVCPELRTTREKFLFSSDLYHFTGELLPREDEGINKLLLNYYSKTTP